MEIEGLSNAYAGTHFHFRVSGGARPTRIDVYIDQIMVLSKDCDDPPCHEMIFIPNGVRGSQVRVTARDAHGNVEQKSFSVVDSDASSGGVMSASG